MTIVSAICVLLLAGTGLTVGDRAVSDQETSDWIRLGEVVADDGPDDAPARVRLEIASRRYERVDGGDGAIELVGVTHIGDATYYEALESRLDRHDFVLYESVAPDGAKGVVAESDDGRRQGTLDGMVLIGRILEWNRMRVGALPGTLSQLIVESAELDTRFPGWIRSASRDGWGETILFETADPEPLETDGTGDPAIVPGRTWTLSSLGADRRPGGAGPEADLVLTSDEIEASRPSRGGIQAEIASALGLRFQLHALDYDRPGWVLADMTDSEMRHRADLLDVDPGPLLEGLSGGGLSARTGRLLLMMIRLADFISGNQIRDIVKVVLVETLADPAALDMAGTGLSGMEGLMDLILHERNKVALECLDRMCLLEPGTSMALFYGAAHMPGLADGLRERGWEPVGQPVWLPAIEVNLEASRVDPGTMAMVRRQLRDSIRALPGTDGTSKQSGAENP